MKRRSLSTRDRVKVFEAHDGVCHLCGIKILAGEAWDVSHEIPLELGGADDASNMLPAHRKCHRTHTAEVDAPAIAKSRRVRAKHSGAYRSANPMPGSRGTKWKRLIGGGAVRRDGA